MLNTSFNRAGLFLKSRSSNPQIQGLMEIICKENIFSGHAVQRMFDRGLKVSEVQFIIKSGEIIASYPDDRPLPSFLFLGWVRERPLHVVVAVDAENSNAR
jgi:hypothetical protein